MNDVIKSSETNDFENFEAMLEESLKSLNTNERVMGTVVGIAPNEVFVDVGRKQAGVVKLNELTDDPKGLYVASVDKNSKFYNKLLVGDVIISINNLEATKDSVLNIIDDSKPGDKITLKVYRKSTKETLTITAELIADKGSSSYSTSDSSNNESYNQDDFNFPIIE